MAAPAQLPFGPLLRRLRKYAGMTQGDLAAAVGYSVTLICALEKGQRQPDIQAVVQRFVPALALQDDPQTAAVLVEQAALARGERPPASVTLQRTTRLHQQAEIAGEANPLPSPPTALIGRAAEVNRLCNRLLGHGGRLLTLLGPPGIGKTTLALAVAAQLQGHYLHGAVFVPLAAVEDAAVMAAAIAAAAGSHDAGPQPPQVKLIEFLRRKQMLLLLDNLEQIPQAATLVAALLAECPGLRILATSRERLHLRAEQRWQVPPLDLAPAVELFTQRATAVNRDFRCTPQNQPVLEEICRQLDCLPLALELCAAQADLLSPAQLLAQVQARPLALLVDGAHDLPPRQRTLHAAIRHSYELLAPAERALLRRLSVFAGSFEIQSVQAMEGTVALLRSLVGKSIVRMGKAAGGEPRYLLLETIREFALEQLRAQDEEAAARERHFAIYLQLFRTGDSHLRGSEALPWLARLQAEQDNLRTAVQWALAAKRYEDAAWLMIIASYYCALTGSAYEETHWLAQLLPQRQALAPDQRLALLLTFYRAAFAIDKFQPVEPYMQEARQLLPGCPYKLLQATAWAFQASGVADAAQAAASLEQGIALTRAAQGAPAPGSEYGPMADLNFSLAAHLWGYAALLIDQGQAVQAAPVAAECLQLFRVRGNRTGIGESLGNLGRLALLRGNFAEARRLLQEATTAALSLHYAGMQYEWQALLAMATLYAGDAAEARRLLQESLRRCLERKNAILLVQVCTYLTELALREGNDQEAEHWLAQSVAQHAASPRITVLQLEQIHLAARLAAAQRRYHRAATLFGLADDFGDRLHYAIAEPLRVPIDTALQTVREALGPDAFAEAFAAGRQLTLEGAFAAIPTAVYAMN